MPIGEGGKRRGLSGSPTGEVAASASAAAAAEEVVATVAAVHGRPLVKGSSLSRQSVAVLLLLLLRASQPSAPTGAVVQQIPLEKTPSDLFCSPAVREAHPHTLGSGNLVHTDAARECILHEGK